LDSNTVFIVSCEHAGNRLPKKYLGLLEGHDSLLSSHEAYDLGALSLAKALSRRLGCRLFAGQMTRLLINLNRSPHNPHRFSRFTRHLPSDEKREIEARYYTPYRSALEEAVGKEIAKHKTIVHLCIHSFAPELRGKRRSADIGLLYDPSRPGERALCSDLKIYLPKQLPEIIVRMNYPYLGVTDGFATYLRKRFTARDYIGIEVEVNQAFLLSTRVPNSMAGLLAAFFKDFRPVTEAVISSR